MTLDRRVIVLVIPTLKLGGAEKVMSELANTWVLQKHQVHVVLLTRDKERFFYIHPDIRVHELGFENKGLIQKIWAELKVIIGLRKVFRTLRPDYILCFMEKYNVITVLSSAFLNLRVVLSDRSNPKKKLPPFLKLLKTLTYRSASGIVAQTSMAKLELAKSVRNKNIRVIPNPVRKFPFDHETSRDKIILNVGRLVPEKAQHYLLEAFALVSDSTWRLVICGDGPLRKSLEGQARALNIYSRTLFAGSVTDIDSWLQKSSIFAFTSISEGFPNALAEAMSAGMAVVSFNCEAGPSDIVQNGINGFLTDVGDVAAFHLCLEKLISNKQLRQRLGERARLVSEKLDINVISDSYLNL